MNTFMNLQVRTHESSIYFLDVCNVGAKEMVAGCALGVFPFEIRREMEKSFWVCLFPFWDYLGQNK